MYVQGVSTRRSAAITEQPRGLDVTTPRVSRSAQALDEELGKWQSHPLDEMSFLILDARYEKAATAALYDPVRCWWPAVPMGLMTTDTTDRAHRFSWLRLSQ